MQPALSHSMRDDADLSAEERAALHAATHTLSEHLKEVNQLLDTSFSNISDQFITISGKVSALADISDEQARKTAVADIGQLISKTIVDMQFQDRVSQNIVIAINTLAAAANNLNVQHAAQMNEALTDELVRLLNLGEIKQKFHVYAAERGWITAEELSMLKGPTCAADMEADDIELF